MKKQLTLAFILLLAGTVALAQTNKEILFRDIPWRTSYTNVRKMIPEIDPTTLSGKYYKTFSVDEIIKDEGLEFDETDINLFCEDTRTEIQVAGYTTSKISMYFAYVPVNGLLTRAEADTALYAASYEFDTTDLNAISSDLRQKLSVLYGVPDSTEDGENLWGTEFKYIYWLGANNTGVVLTIHHPTMSTFLSSDSVTLTYFTRQGDDWLKAASDAEVYRINQGKNAIADSEDVSGL